MINLRFTPQDEDDNSQVDPDDIGFDYNPTPQKNKRKSKKKKFDESDVDVVYEKDLKKGGIKYTPEESNSFEEDRVLRTSFYLSTYANNLVSMIKKSHKPNKMIILSKPKVLLEVTSSAIDDFINLVEDKYYNISEINQRACIINASSGKVSIEQPTLKIDMSINEDNEHVDALILSSTTTKIKMLAEEFGVTSSCIVEYLIYMYVCESDNIIYTSSKKYCEERMGAFITQLDKFILESSHIDENVLINIGYKMSVQGIVECTRTNNNFKDTIRKTISLDYGEDENITIKITHRKGKNKKKTYDESHSKGIFNKDNKKKGAKGSK